MMISTHGRYALRILVDLTENQRDGYVTLRDIAQRQEISEKYLESIAKKLVQGKLLTGLRGKGGGYRLSRSPDEINVLEVLELMEGTLSPVACLGPERAPCSRMAVCPTLPLWQGLDKVVRDYLRGATIQSLARSAPQSYDYVI